MLDVERGLRISELRKQRGLNQSDAADRLGVTLRAYQAWEYGGGIRGQNLERLVAEFKTTRDYILGSGDTPLRRIEEKIDQILQYMIVFDERNR